MHKIITIFIIFIAFSTCVNAKSQYSETLGRIENSLYGIQYANQTDAQRLNRIEESVYGEVSKDNIKIRINKLNQDVSADVMGKEIKPKYDTFADENDPYYEENKLEADNSVHYPIIDKMEQQVFNKKFNEKNIELRLSELEKKTFKKDFSKDDLDTRTERLKLALIKDEKQQPDFYTGGYYPTDSDFYNYTQPQKFSYTDNMPTYKPPMSFGNYNDEKSLARLEKKILKRSYNNENIERRLSRLETALFNTSFTEDDSQTRLSRVESVYAAQKSSQKYDSFSKHVSTAVQIGTILLMVLAMVL